MRSQKLEFPGASGHTLAGRLERPEGEPRAWAVFAHCFTCSKDIAAASRISRELGRRGYAVLRFDFTGLGNSDGDFANTDFSSNVQDLIAAANFLREHHEAPALLVGHSLGGAAVLGAALQLPEVRAVATIGAPSDPAHVTHLLQDQAEQIERDGAATVCLAGRPFTIRREFLADVEEQNLRARLPKLDAAVLLLHSPRDEVVNIDHARLLYESLRHPKSFVTLDDADHLLTRRRDSEYVAEVLAAWASRYVTEAEPTPDPGRGAVVVAGDADGFVQHVAMGPHDLIADEPTSVGGGDTGPAPYDLLLASLGTCTSMTLGMYARRKKLPLEHVAVHLTNRRIDAKDCDDCETQEGQVAIIERTIELTGDLDDAQRARLLQIAERCPVHRTLHGEIKIRSQARVVADDGRTSSRASSDLDQA
ncbi:MAG: alpha/beta fold hydrolase [Planctomycetota bacterium]